MIAACRAAIISSPREHARSHIEPESALQLSRFLRFTIAALGFASCIAGGISPALAQSNSSAQAPYSAKAFVAPSLRLDPDLFPATTIELDAVDAGLVDAAKQANTAGVNKRLQIGIGRKVAASAADSSAALQWIPVAGGIAAHWEVSSPGARALRIGLAAARMSAGSEIRFAGRGDIGTVYGPFTANDLHTAGATYWSPVLEGDHAIVEVYVAAGGSPSDVALTVTQVSHLFASPADPNVASLAKAASGSCEVDLICRSASDAALASAGKAVARMTFSDAAGTYLCTGTLLNPSDGSFIPYFYSANHCISTQASADTLTTYWFYDAVSCGSTSANPNAVQITVGATLLYANQASDGMLVRLNGSPPAGAVYAGWNAATLSVGTPLTAIHHPEGDVTKVSLGTVGGFELVSGGPSGSLIHVNWNSTATGVTEPGSSGSGIFTLDQPANQYRLRGGLYGGPSSCTATAANLYDDYSRFDQIYPYLAMYLNPASTSCTYSVSPANQTASGSGATGTVAVTTQPGCPWSATSTVSWITATSTGSGSGAASYSVDANDGSSTRTGTVLIGGRTFTVTQGVPISTGVNVVANGDFESGAVSWTQTSGLAGVDIITNDPNTAHSGNWYAWLGGYNSGTDTLTQDVTIPADATSASLQFWYRIDTFETSTTAVHDTMTVSLADPSSGATLATLASFSNLDDTTGLWVRSTAYDVTAFQGRTVRLKFSALNDSANITSFLIDDVSLNALSNNYTALWWNPNESGWGINIVHQGDILFATLFDYANDNPGSNQNQGLWLVMSDGEKQAGSDTYTGALYRTTGPAFNAVPFNPITTIANYNQVGTMTLAFSGSNAGTLTYTVNGATVTKSIEKLVYGAAAADCQPTTSSRKGLTNYQDLWWNPAESGWGINITQQGNILFATLFTYAASDPGSTTNPGLWLVMSDGELQPDGSYLGDLYQTTGPAFNADQFTPITNPPNYTKVGTMRFTFTDGENGTLVYTVNGASVSKVISRLVFASPVPACSG